MSSCENWFSFSFMLKSRIGEVREYSSAIISPREKPGEYSVMKSYFLSNSLFIKNKTNKNICKDLMSEMIRPSIHPALFMTEICKITFKVWQNSCFATSELAEIWLSGPSVIDVCCSFQGEQGERGDRGVDGATGTPGLPGEPGRDGSRGLKGEKVSRARAWLIHLMSYWHYCLLNLYCACMTFFINSNSKYGEILFCPLFPRVTLARAASPWALRSPTVSPCQDPKAREESRVRQARGKQEKMWERENCTFAPVLNWCLCTTV